MQDIFKDPIALLATMAFFHVLADFVLQGVCLYKLKESKTRENLDEFYKYDWVPSILIHGFSWAFMVMLPVLVTNMLPTWKYAILLATNAIIHSVVDHLKANLKVINLCHDQFLHLLQIVGIWVCAISGVQ